MKSTKTKLTGLFVAAGLSVIAMAATAQTSHMDMGKGRTDQPAPIRATMSELHARDGVPRGWKFLVPPGDAVEGRKAFVALECFACHEVAGEDFPDAAKTPKGAGPALTGMGAHHPAEYFAESIMNPNRVIVVGTGYTGADGRSKMPSYAESMTLKQLIDVVAYLKSLTEGGMDHKAHMSGSSMPEGTMKMK